MNIPNIPSLIINIFTLVVAISVHEFAHAWTADHFGDDTPRRQGRLTLNPLAHLDPIGSLMMVVAGFGWGKPVEINGYLLMRRSPAAMMWVSLAGPLSNFLLALLAAIPIRMGLVLPAFSSSTLLPSLFQFLLGFIAINLFLMLFNLIPVMPLDGEKIALYFLPPSLARPLETIRPYGPVILLGIIFVGPLIGIDLISLVINPVRYLLARLLIGY